MIESKGYYKIFTVAIIAFWLVIIGLLVKRTYLDSHGLSHPPALAHPGKTDFIPGQGWMGIYMGKDKIGYSVTTVQKMNDVYLVSEKILMKLRVMDTPQKIDIVTDSVINQDFSLKSFRFRLQSGVVRFRAEAEVKGNEMDLHIDSVGRKIRKTIPFKTTPYLSSSLRFVLMRDGLSVGKEFSLPIFDPSTMSNNVMTVNVEGKERIKIDDKMVLAYRLKESFKGVTVKAWISEEGKILREESPMGIVLIKETREKALTENWEEGPGLDIIASTAVPVNTSIKRPKSVKYLKVRLEGFPLDDFNFASRRQVLKGDILEITQEEINTDNPDPLRVKGRGFERYLASSLFVQSNAPEIIEEANKIIGGERDSVEKTRLLMDRVYKTIEKKPTISIPSALETLKSKVGDCNEHTILFTALTRAVGIPTRIVTGIVLFEDSFLYHTWAEIYEGKWISIDPTMNQFPADATHIGFVEGELDKQVEMMKVIGNLRVEILEYK